MADLNAIRLLLVEELTLAHGSGSSAKYICPICGSGNGPKKTAAFSIDPKSSGTRGTCFSCGFHGDIFDLIAARDGLSLQEATAKAIQKYEGTKTARPAAISPPVRQNEGIKENVHTFPLATGTEAEKYLAGRGITKESISRFLIRYDDKQRRILIPHDPAGRYFSMRSIDAGAHLKHAKPSGLASTLFNGAALHNKKPCFIVESPLCAISIMQEAGSEANAVALCGVNTSLLQGEISKKAPSCVLLLCLDNDTPKENGKRPGQDAQEALAKWLEEKGIPFEECNVSGEWKDPNEALQKEPENFRERVLQAVKSCTEGAETDAKAYSDESAFGFISAFMDGVSEAANTPPISTGFQGLDALLDGGLFEGLYTVGAISSLGKTSFVLQLCDQIAAAGNDVLYFSLEMSRFELMAKSISRLTYGITKRLKLSQSVAKTTRGILSGSRYKKYNQMEIETISSAVDEYEKTISRRIWFVEGVGNIGTTEIRQDVERHIRNTGRRPVVVIDYLQLLAPVEIKATDKQNTDRNVLELKRLSRDEKISVIGISSLNRDSYTDPVNMAAFKESGAIEYGSDCLIGLQHLGMEYVDGEKEKERDIRVRQLFRDNENASADGKPIQIELKILKNRNGKKGGVVFSFMPMFNAFEETLSTTEAHQRTVKRI